MEKKVMSKDYMLNNRDDLIEKFTGSSGKNNKPGFLTKKERKTLGIGKDRGEATAKHVRISPRKVNIVVNLIKGKSLDDAYAILTYTPKAASPVLLKLLKSAEANAVNNNNLNRDELYVSDAYANQASTLKRIMPRARGSAARILKRASHVTVVVKERV